MTARAFLLALLLACNAQFGVGVSQVAPPRAAQVIVVADVAERLAEESSEPARNRPLLATIEKLPGLDEPRVVSAPHANLFQRPPPRALPFV